MNPLIRNIVAVIVGILAGSFANLGLAAVGMALIPPPGDVNLQDIESIKNSMGAFEFKHYIFPFLAHAIGTLVGAYLACLLGKTRKMTLAIIVGVWFLIMGIINVILLGTGIVPSAIDLVIAYIPMALIGGRLALPKTLDESEELQVKDNPKMS